MEIQLLLNTPLILYVLPYCILPVRHYFTVQFAKILKL